MMKHLINSSRWNPWNKFIYDTYRYNLTQMPDYRSVSRLHSHISICIERPEIVTCSTTPLENNFYHLLKDIEFENSFKSNHELQKEKELDSKLAKQIDTEIDFTESIKQSAQDIEERGQKELKDLQIVPRFKGLYSKNKISDTSSKNSHFLVIKFKDDMKNERWTLPRETIINGESIKEVVKRILTNYCEENFKMVFYGNIPLNFVANSNKKDSKEQYKIKNGKEFYIFGRYVSGSIKRNVEYQWLELQKLQEVLPIPEYHCLRQSLQIPKLN